VTPDHKSALHPDQKRTLVVGASLKTERFSNIAVRKLSEYHVPVIAVGLRAGEINGITVHKPFPIVENIHTVTLYVGPKHQPFWYDFILNAKPKRVIFNPGTYHEEFQQMLINNGIEVVEECTLIMLSDGDF
jgi:predicted CoA-binding protein